MTFEKKFLLLSTFSAIFIVAGFALLMFIGNEGIPFVEGDTLVTEGSAFGFTIGTNRKVCLSDVIAGYNKPKHSLRVVWPVESAIHKTLREFENTDWAQYEHRKFAEYEEPISAAMELAPPLALADRWNIQMPAEWVNAIHLTFKEDSLVEIRRSRWVFERP